EGFLNQHLAALAALVCERAELRGEKSFHIFALPGAGSQHAQFDPSAWTYRRASGAHRIDGVGKPLALALHALPAGNLTFAGGIERSVANLDLTLSLVMADDQAIWRDAGPSQLERMRLAEPSANSFLPPPSTTGTVKMLIASTRSLASSAWTSSVPPWVTRFGPSSCFRRFTPAMSRRSTEPAQLVSTSPERETAYFLMSLNSLAMPPWGASS